MSSPDSFPQVFTWRAANSLAVADSSTGITYVYYITLSCHDLQRVLKFQTFLRRRASAIVIDNERILFRSIEVGRKNVETVNRIAACCLELPIVTSANGYITIKLIKVDAADSLGIGLCLFSEQVNISRARSAQFPKNTALGFLPFEAIL